MEKNGEQLIKDSKKTKTGIKCAYLIFIILIIAASVIMNYRLENNKPEAIDFTKNGAVGMETEKYAYLNIEGLTDEVAIYGNVENENDSTNDRYYIAISGGYLYLVDLNFDLIEQLKPMQEYTYSDDENAVMPSPIKIYGITESVPTELKQYAIDFYNESVGPEYAITVDDFENYFGSVLLNARREPVETQWETLAICLGIFGLIIVVGIHLESFIKTRKTTKYLKKNNYEEDIVQQLDDFVEEKHCKDKVILTKDYFVDIQHALVAFKYSDVKWIHVHHVKSYGITVSSSIIVHLNDGKTKIQCLEIRGKNTDEFVEIFNKICDKTSPETLKGYTQENIKAFKEYKKALKNKEL